MCRRMVVIFVLLACLISSASADLVGWWRFDAGSGTVAGNSGTTSEEATLIGGPVWETDEDHASFVLFDGADDHIFIEEAGFELPVYSVAMWFRVDGGTGQRDLMTLRGLASGKPGILFEIQADGTLRYLHRFPFGGSGGNNIYTEASYDDGTWHHATMVKSPDEMTLYMDGELVGTQADSGVLDGLIGRIWLGTLDERMIRMHNGGLDDLRVYDQVLTNDEVKAVMLGKGPGVVVELASLPSPDDGSDDVLRSVVLNWSVGEFAASHNVYFGTEFDDVNDADITNPLDALISQGQEATSYDAGKLAFGQTYYWRVDEVNGAPDNTIYKGDVWSFTVEPKAIPIQTVTATALSESLGMEASKTIDGSGLSPLDEHSVAPTDMWLTITEGSWIQYEFDKLYKLHEMLIWNSNQIIEAFIGFGVKGAIIETSIDGENWTVVEGVTDLAQAPGAATYKANNTVSLNGVMAKFVKLLVVSAHGLTDQSGLSEVRFLAIPVTAREPQPVDGATTATPTVDLGWRSGREAASHEVYLGTDAANLQLIDTVSTAAMVTDPLDYGTTYFWSVTEVNDAADPTAHAGAVWSFSTPEYATVDDFEAYSGEEGEEVYMTWADGFGGDASLGGSTTGHIDGPFVETSIVNSGNQSMPVYIDNDGGFFDIDGKSSSPNFSEVVRDLDSQDWTASGVKSLSIMFAGSSGLTGQLYCKIGGTKVLYDGDASNISSSAWQAWNIDLSTVGGSLKNVRELAFGVEGGTSGILYIDDIRLYTRL